MTQRASLTQSGSSSKKASRASLTSAIELHLHKEKVSLHTPGHKGRVACAPSVDMMRYDVTELPGLDELAHAQGVLQELEEQLAKQFDSATSFISVNGASHCLMAAILACASRGTHALIPRNAHRSVIQALVLSGLSPIWYEPDINKDWLLYTQCNLDTFSTALEKNKAILACALIVSPTYAGSISDTSPASLITKQHSVPLIVDEAHGAHLPFVGVENQSALASQADIVVHSLHKTLNAMTQTGLVHVKSNSLVPPQAVRASLTLLNSSSPSYVLMSSISNLQTGDLSKIERVVQRFRQELLRHGNVSVLNIGFDGVQDPFHVHIRIEGMTAVELFDGLAAHGVYAEACLGTGVLLLFGAGSNDDDANTTLSAIGSLLTAAGTNQRIAVSNSSKCGEGEEAITKDDYLTAFPVLGEQVFSPREAYFAKTELVRIEDAVGRIAAECIAPCPPGIPLVVPGARITEQTAFLCKVTQVRVIAESSQGDN